MRFVKLAIISFLLFALAIIGISFLLPSTVVVTRGVDINASIDSVATRLNNLNRWQTWISNKDTLVIKADERTFMMGKMHVVLVSASASKIITSWKVKEGQPLDSRFSLTTQKSGANTTVQWEFVQHLKWYPWEKFSSAITDKVLGPFMEESLKNLKESIEN
jgi:hypothetical protein